jgi:transposase InsO family protein
MLTDEWTALESQKYEEEKAEMNYNYFVLPNPDVQKFTEKLNIPKSILKKFSQFGQNAIIIKGCGVEPNKEYNIRKHIIFAENAESSVMISTNTVLDQEPVNVLDLPKRRSSRIQAIKDVQEEMRGLVQEMDNRRKTNRARRSQLFHEGLNKERVNKDKIERIKEETLINKFTKVDALVGQFYLHPESGALMEIVGSRKGTKHQMFVVSIERMDDETNFLIDEEDLHRIKLEEAIILVAKYNGQENLVDGSLNWPQTFQDWKLLQEKDDFCIKIMLKLKESENGILPLHPSSKDAQKPIPSDFLFQPIINGVSGPLMRQFIQEREIIRDREIAHLKRRIEQKVVPHELIQLCIEIHHDKFGHPGRSRTENTIKLGYFWSTINQDVARYVKNCHYCQCRKANNQAALVPIQEYDPVDRPFQRTHVDLSGPFNITTLGNKYILVFKDALTKWVEIFALSDKTAIEALTCFDDEIVQRHGIPELLITDRGTEFSNKNWKDFMKLHGIRHVRTTPANPRSDGLAENMMRTLKDMLSSFVNKYHNDWDQHLAHIAGQYRSTVNDATGYTPYYLLYGREMAQREVTDSNKFKNLHDYAANLQEVLSYTWSSVSLREKQNVKVMQQLPRKRLPFKPFVVGSYCFLKTVPRRFFKNPSEKKIHKLSSKLQFRYSGPYRIVKVISPVLYVADIHGENKKVHAINMKHK